MAEFLGEEPTGDDVVTFKLRLPISGATRVHRLLPDHKVLRLFHIVQAHYWEEFEEPFAEFDLTQTYPSLSLQPLKSKSVAEVFESSNENLIVKELS